MLPQTLDDLEALRALARAEQTVGETADAERHFRECLKKRPDYVRAWHGCLALLLEQGELERFLAILAVAPGSADADAETWYFRGIASEKAGDWSAAASHFRKAIELNPFLQKCLYRLGMAEGRLGLHDQAVVHRRKSTEMNETRGRFPAAYSAYFAAREPGGAATAARRLAADLRDAGMGASRSSVGPRGRRTRVTAPNVRSPITALLCSIDHGTLIRKAQHGARSNPDLKRSGCESSGSLILVRHPGGDERAVCSALVAEPSDAEHPTVRSCLALPQHAIGREIHG